MTVTESSHKRDSVSDAFYAVSRFPSSYEVYRARKLAIGKRRTIAMIIPINIVPSGSTSRTLPPQLAQFGTDELVLIDLQGSLDVEGDKQGQTVGKLRIDDVTVRLHLRNGGFHVD